MSCEECCVCESDAEECMCCKALENLKEAAQFALATLEHAIELDYLGDGSTLGMANDAIDTLKRALGDSE